MTSKAENGVLFTKQMKIATKEIHSMSDALINAKLGLAMSSSRVWAEGLLVFYEVFKWLEGILDEPPHHLISQLDVPGIRRTALFEQDLEFYLGKEWKEGYSPRESVVDYLKHLESLRETDPLLLLAYYYHLYMGLLSGGQILRRKRALLQKLKFNRNATYEGLAVTEIKEGTVHFLKKTIANTMNEIADDLDDETRQKLIEESKMVFRLNDKMVQTIEGTGEVLFWKFVKFSAVALCVGLSAVFIKRAITTSS